MADRVALIESFLQRSKMLEDELKGTLVILAEGRAPSEEESLGLSVSMADLREAYSKIQIEAQSIRADIDTGKPVSVYRELFDEYEASKLAERIASLAIVLRRFARVVSDNEEYSTALFPYQKEAADTLRMIESDGVDANSKRGISCDGQKMFLKALSMDADVLLSDAGESLLDSLDAFYSRKVVRGIMRGQYKELSESEFVVSRDENEEGEHNLDNLPIVDGGESFDETRSSIFLSAESEPEARDAVERGLEAKDAFRKKPDTALRPFGEGEQIERPLNDDDFDNDGILDKSEITIEPLNGVKKSGNVSAASFKKELPGMPSLVRDILPLMSKFGAMGEEHLILMISMLCKESDEALGHNVRQVVSVLMRKGFLSSFDVENFGVVYALTGYGRSLLDKETIKTLRAPKSNKLFWHVPICANALVVDGPVRKNVLCAVLKQSDLLVSFFEMVHENRTLEGLYSVYVGTDNVDGRFIVPVQWGYQDFRCSLFGPSDDVCLGDNVIIVCKDGEPPSIDSSSKVENAFLVDGPVLMKWNGAWVREDEETKYDNVVETAAPEDEQENRLFANEDEESDEVLVVGGADGTDAESGIGAKAVDSEKVLEEDSKDIVCSGGGSSLSTECLIRESNVFARIEKMSEQADVPTDDEFVEIAEELLANATELVDPEDDFSNLAGAFTLLAAAATIGGNKKSKLFLDQLALATGQKVEEIEGTGRTIASSFPDYSRENEALRFSAYCLALFAPHMAYDYDLNSAVDMFLGDFEEYFPSLVAFKPLLNELSGIRDISPDEGLSDNVLDMMGNQAQRSKRLKEMRDKATELYNPPKIKAKLRGIPQFNNACFGKESELHLCMQIIEEDKREDAGFVRDVYDSYCTQTGAVKQIDKAVIENRIDDEWHSAVEGKSTSRIRKLGSEPRKKAQDGFYARLELMRKWLSYDGGKVDADTLSKLKKKKDSITEIISELTSVGTMPTMSHGVAVLKWMLHVLGNKLAPSDAEPVMFASLLKTGVISLDDEMYPFIDGALNEVCYYEPWRNALRHLSMPTRSFAEVRSLVFDDDTSALFDNLRQVSLINKISPDGAVGFEVTSAHFEQAEEAAESETNKFQDGLEIAYAYGQINETQKEDLAASVSAFRDSFFSMGDYGCWRQFLLALKSQVDTMAAPQEEELRARFQGHKSMLKKGATSTLLDEAERLLNEEKNFTVVEDYLNRFDAGQTELTDELSVKLRDPDLFSEFISDGVFRPLYDTCIRAKGAPLSSFGKEFLKNKYPAAWTTRQKESSELLVKSWPVKSSRYSGDMLAQLMKSIGFKVRGKPEVVKKEKRELYRVTVKPEAADRADYGHPISAFGTQIKSPMNVLILYGNHTPQEIIDVVAAENIVGIAIVFINYPISLAARRQMAEIFHTKKSRLTSFLLVDQVLALHLALHQETERMPLMLKCTLPFTYYQPFVRDGGPTADEMFCGREHELQTIIDPNGASIVYGGRQLGKTALLERAKSLRMKPDNNEYAVYVSILSCSSEESVAKAVSNAMRHAQLDLPECVTLQDVCREINKVMQEGIASRLLLLLDESDRFLASISGDGYVALQPLIDLKRETKNNFKFVLAGLHNVSRMKNATSRNGILGQLGEPLCIKPLSPKEALQLISRPLTYLGFQVDRYPHLETILTSTNYYPGILQFFGYTLVETMTKQYGDYYRATDGNPPYTLHKEQLGAIMNRSDLNNSIKEKFRWSLELDPRYFMIARCMALMCYDVIGRSEGIDTRKGFSVDEIKRWADDLGIRCLKKETPQTYVNLLDEMVDMGILVRPVQEVPRFRLRRNSFLSIIGPDLDTILDDIDSNNALED